MIIASCLNGTRDGTKPRLWTHGLEYRLEYGLGCGLKFALHMCNFSLLLEMTCK